MSWFITAFKKYAVFKGRARRKEYWMFMLVVYIIYGVLGGLGFATHMPIFVVGLVIALLVFALPTWAVTVRRLHDSGLSGWLILIGLAPTIGMVALTTFCCAKSNEGANKYGPNPKAVLAAA
ncbi:DUF805 domain-containing protein [Streptomyces sp. NPDC093248]|uniref:DUF805 domain-containing protein n=1 Tax=Streptomyces sp. NPDC093248 TaxID=3155072 RepID=UPI0034393FFF